MAEQSKFTALNIPPPSEDIPKASGTGSAFLPPAPDDFGFKSSATTGTVPLPPPPSDFILPATKPSTNNDSDDTVTMAIAGPSEEIPAAQPLSRKRGGMSFSI